MKLSELGTNHHENQMTSLYISFSDLMMLLLVFFLMLLSMSKIDKGSYEAIRSGFTGSTKGTLVELAQDLSKMVNGDPGVPGVKVHLAQDGVRLDLDTGALFDTGSARLKPNALDPLMPLLEKIKGTSYAIEVEGHTDDVPLHRFYTVDSERDLETNWSLSGRRSSSVIHKLLDLGFAEGRLRLVGYASTRPLTVTEGKEGQALDAARSDNRRVSLLVR